VGRKRKRKSSQKYHDDVSSTLFAAHESTKFTNLLADLDSTMQLIQGPKPTTIEQIACSDPTNVNKILQHASLQFFQISLSN